MFMPTINNIVYASNDPYKKNYKIDVLNYIFDITLSDTTDLIQCEVTVDLMILDSSIEKIKLDLINASENLENKGMIVYNVKSDNGSLKFLHEENELWIYLDQIPIKNDRKKFTISYQGIPSEGLYIRKNK